LIGLVAGLLAGLVTGGSLDNFARLDFRWPVIVVVAIVVKALLLLPPLDHLEGAQWLYAASLAVIVVWSFAHLRRLPGIWAVGAGAALNLAVILANGARMPVEAALAGDLLRQGPIGQYTLMGSGSHLNFLGDWISIPPLPETYSPGDLVIAVGLALVAFMATRRRPDSQVD
jgi:hypothetical protein